jgi:outer membrane protein TolC
MSSAIELEKSLQRSIRLGEKSNTELLFVRKGLFSVKKELALARYTQINAYLRLHQYLGDLSLEHFQKIAYHF